MSSLSIVLIGVLLGTTLAGSSIPDAKVPATKRYSFSYDVKDPYSGQDFGHQEKLEDIVTGEYHVLLPDDRFQVVNYRADHNGYVADVKYGEGTSSTYVNKGRGSSIKYKDHPDTYGNSDAKYNPSQSHGKQEDSKQTEKTYGKQHDKYAEQNYDKEAYGQLDRGNNHPDPSIYEKTSNAHQSSSSSAHYNPPSSSGAGYSTGPIMDGAGYSTGPIMNGAGYSTGPIMDGAGYSTGDIMDGAGYSTGPIMDGADGYGSHTVGLGMKNNYGGSYLADFAAGVNNKQQPFGYGPYSAPNNHGCKCV